MGIDRRLWRARAIAGGGSARGSCSPAGPPSTSADGGGGLGICPTAMVVLDRISGGNPEGWIVQAELYFTYLGFSEKDWLPLPYHYLDGAALAWFDWLFRNKQFFDWNHFKEKLKLHFRTRTREELGGCLAIHQQRKPMADLLARVAAIPSWCKINTSSSPQHWKKHSDRNNLNLAYEVFEEMSGTIRDNEAVV
ncbi:hypothetical protein A4A49_17461 [Nicotiana attenuata]|uniref:Retrotransposon gag domain-containing protein n=1 Tax=Nicotiana attenuata TaxID=49451 RepID=A0A1J6IAT0_NICAT|nr:hypothetical protein A4A49_17461 [Nicotiana attenuata]